MAATAGRKRRLSGEGPQRRRARGGAGGPGSSGVGDGVGGGGAADGELVERLLADAAAETRTEAELGELGGKLMAEVQGELKALLGELDETQWMYDLRPGPRSAP